MPFSGVTQSYASERFRSASKELSGISGIIAVRFVHVDFSDIMWIG